MIIYFADRAMRVLGHATTNLPKGYVIRDDLKSEDVETGVATFSCYVGYAAENRAELEVMTAPGNYLLRSNDGEKEFYTIIDSDIDTKRQEIYIYAEDAGLDLINEIVGEFEAAESYSAEWYINKCIIDSGFEIGINEIPPDSKRKLKWEGEATVTQRLASIATQFGGYEISFTFDIKGLEITHKYVHFHKERGKDNGVQLRLNYEVDKIITSRSVANLATAFICEGGVPDDSDVAITLKGYKYDDGDFYVDANGKLKSRKAVEKWSRYVWNKEPNKLSGYEGHIVRPYSYNTTSQSELCSHAIAELKKYCDMEVNYEVDIKKLPEGVKIGDRVNIIDDAGGLYLSTRILKFETSITDQKYTATLGEHLIKGSGISQKVEDLAAQFAKAALSAARALTEAKAAKDEASEALLVAAQSNDNADEALLFAQNAYNSAEDARNMAGSAEYFANIAKGEVDGVKESVIGIEKSIANAEEVAEQAAEAARTAQEKVIEVEAAASNAEKNAAEAVESASEAKTASEKAKADSETAVGTANDAISQAQGAAETAAAAKLDSEQAQRDILALGEQLTTVSNTMTADYTRKTELTETVANLQTQISQNAGQISITAGQVSRIDETANTAKAQAEAAQRVAEAAQAQADDAAADALEAQQAAADAQGKADAAQREATAAQEAATTAQEVVDKAEEDLQKAKEDLATVQGRVDATEEDLAEAQAAVEAAQEKADEAKAAADAAAANAETAQGKADDAKAEAEAAQGVADDAAATASAAQALANEAKGDASEAKETAGTAASTAAQAQAKAAEAIANAETAQGKADDAKAIAEQAQADAEEAITAGATALVELDKSRVALAEAQQNLAEVTSRVGATEEEIAAAQAAVEKAQEDVEKAQAAAEAADAAAKQAADDAASAQQAADTAQEKADEAKAAADAAQEDVDALAVRVSTAETKITQNSEAIALMATKTEVAETLGGYYTKEQTDAAIELKADSITQTVSSTYATITDAASAQQAADTAQAKADEAKEAADTAQEKADEAKEAADAAQEDVDALAVRVSTAETDIVQTKESITLMATKTEVTTALSGYYTKTEADAAIQVKADEITQTVSETYSTIDDLTLEKAETQAAIAEATAAHLKAIEDAEDALNAQLALKAAQSDLTTAQQYLETVTGRVGATEEEIAEAQRAVTKAQEDVVEAQRVADTAQAKADEAKEAADAAQEDVDALAVRVSTAETKITQNSEAIALMATKTEVAETLGGYYTKEQTDAAIELKADSITQTVSSTYATITDAASAQQAADTAQAKADEAKEAADTAQEKADEAQEAADAAQEGVNALAVRVSTAETDIVQTKESITLMATKTEVTTALSGYYTKTEADAAIQVKAGEITQTVSSEIITGINDIQVGGRNQIKLNQLTPVACTMVATSTNHIEISDVSTGNMSLLTFSGEYVPGIYVLNAKGSVSDHKFRVLFSNKYDDNCLSNTYYEGYGYPYFKDNVTLPLSLTFTETTKIGLVMLSADGSQIITGLKLEIGNKATDWTPAPEDVDADIGEVANTANNAYDTANTNADRLEVAESTIQQLADSISMLVTDGNGTSLMTQTADGWVFSTKEIQDQINTASQGLGTLQSELGDTNNTVSILNEAVESLGVLSEYIKIGTYTYTDENGDTQTEPSIDLGETDTGFKLKITNTRILFTDGTTELVQINSKNKSLEIERAKIKTTLQMGGFMWETRENGNLGLTWKGVNN